MIGRLTGTVIDRGLDGACVLDVGGVGYEVFVPLGALGRLPGPPEPTTLHVHTHVREDALVLYGFVSANDRAAFRAVLGVSGVGPKLALALLGTLDAVALADAVARGDRGRFKGIPGVGKKTVERLVLELKDKLGALVADAGPRPVARRAAPTSDLVTVANALVQMGYRNAEAERAVASLTETENKPVQELLREALVALS